MRNKAILLLGLFAGIVAACGKATPDVVDPFADSPWVADETQLVPIQFGQNRAEVDLTDTKAGAIISLDDMPFGILALDEAYLTANSFTPAQDGTDALLLLNRKGVKTVRDIDGTNYDVVQFKEGSNDITYYYPIYSNYNYSFFGYKTTAFASDEPNLTWDATNHTYTIPGIQVGAYDILWAVAYEDAQGNHKDNGNVILPSFEYASQTYYGYNARFMRKAKLRQADANGSGPDATFYANNLPKLNFKHMTAALHFMVQAHDDVGTSFGTAQNPLVQITGVKVSGTLITEATMDVVNGTLTGTASADSDITLSGDPFMPTTTATEFGDGLFILPTTNPLTLTFTLSEPNNRTETVTVDLTSIQPAGGFEAGKSYTFKIVVHSLETAHVKVYLNDFVLDPGDYNIEVE